MQTNESWLTAFVSVNKIYSLVMYLKQTKDISVDIILKKVLVWLYSVLTLGLENIVKKLKEKRKEKDNAITDLKHILSKLNENLQHMEKKLEILESRRDSATEHPLHNTELSKNVATQQQNENSNLLSSFISKANSSILMNGQKR